MFTLLTDVGKLNLNAVEPEHRIQFDSYRVGYIDPEVVPDYTNVTFVGNEFVAESVINTNFVEGYTARATEMWHLLVDSERTVLKLKVPATSPYFRVNCIVLMAKIQESDTVFPFLISYALEDNPKFSTEINKFGTTYYHMLQLQLTARESRFYLGNMKTETPLFGYLDYNYTVPLGHRVNFDQAILNNHVNLQEGLKVFAINSEEQFYGVIANEWNYDVYFGAVLLNGEQVTLGDEDMFLSFTQNNIVLNN